MGRWSTAPAARAAATSSAPLGSPSTITCARGSSSSSDRMVVRDGERPVDQHGVVRMLADGRDRGRDARDPVHVDAAAVQQRAEVTAVGLVGRDEEQHEGWLSHGSKSDTRVTLKTEQ